MHNLHPSSTTPRVSTSVVLVNADQLPVQSKLLRCKPIDSTQWQQKLLCTHKGEVIQAKGWRLEREWANDGAEEEARMSSWRSVGSSSDECINGWMDGLVGWSPVST